MTADLRDFLRQLEEQGPDEWLRIKKQVSLTHEATALLFQLEERGRFPAVYFENIQESAIPMVTNLHATRSRLALALGVGEGNLVEAYRNRQANPVAPTLVGDGPVKAVVNAGTGVDVGRLPLPIHFDISTARYMTAGIVVARDPLSGVRNLSFNRGMLVGPRRLRMHLAPGMQLNRCYRAAEAQDTALEVAIVIGVHPAFALGALALAPFDVDEYDVIGGMMQAPVPLVRCETVALEVPATAEIVLEGRLLPHVREDEGPFGEFSGHSVGVAKHHVVEISGLMHRENPIYQDIFTGHSEQRLMGSIPREAALFKAVQAVAPGTRAIHMPVSGCCRFHCYIALEKRSTGEVRQAMMAAFAADLYLKHVIVVDADIDVYNERDVLWAVANRVQAHRDLLIIPDCQGSEIDPSAEAGGITTKMAIDATKKSDNFPQRLDVPKEVRARVKLEDYLP